MILSGVINKLCLFFKQNPLDTTAAPVHLRDYSVKVLTSNPYVCEVTLYSAINAINAIVNPGTEDTNLKIKYMDWLLYSETTEPIVHLREHDNFPIASEVRDRHPLEVSLYSQSHAAVQMNDATVIQYYAYQDEIAAQEPRVYLSDVNVHEFGVDSKEINWTSEVIDLINSQMWEELNQAFLRSGSSYKTLMFEMMCKMITLHPIAAYHILRWMLNEQVDITIFPLNEILGEALCLAFEANQPELCKLIWDLSSTNGLDQYPDVWRISSAVDKHCSVELLNFLELIYNKPMFKTVMGEISDVTNILSGWNLAQSSNLNYPYLCRLYELGIDFSEDNWAYEKVVKVMKQNPLFNRLVIACKVKSELVIEEAYDE